jgi:ABC-2 type transport system permease protein
MIIFQNIIAIFRKELQGYFASSFAYIVMGIFWLLAGFFLVAILLSPEGIISQVAQRDKLGVPTPPVDVAYEFLRFFLGVMGSLAMFVLPILSMGLYAEERKWGTLELLATSPITNWAVAVGKLLGVMAFFSVMIAPLLGIEAIVLGAANPPIPVMVPLLGHLGLFLMAGAVLSLGMFISSLTDKTIVAAILTFALIFSLSLVELLAKSIGGSVGVALEHLSLMKHYTNLVQGVLTTSSLILFSSYIVLGIFLTAQSIEALRFSRR